MNDSRKFDNSRPATRRIDFARSGLVTTAFLAILIGFIFFLFHERGKGHLHKLTSVAPAAPPPPLAQPGGKEAISLGRLSLVNGSEAELLSSTILPGFGMTVLDLRASFPMLGERSILKSLPLQQVAVDGNRLVRDPKTPPEADSQAISSTTSPILAWVSDKPLNLDSVNSAAITLQAAESPENHAMPDGGDATAVFPAVADAAPGAMPPHIEMRTSALLSGRAFELSLTARNAGAAAVPLRLGWLPHFVLPSGKRSDYRLVIPANERVMGNKTISTVNTPSDFSTRSGRAVGSGAVDITLTHLTRDFLSPGSEMQILDPESGYGIRLVTLTPNIRSVRIISPAGADWISLIPVADSMDTVANHIAGATGVPPTHGLAPGATMQWKVRVELIELSKSAAPDTP